MLANADKLVLTISPAELHPDEQFIGLLELEMAAIDSFEVKTEDEATQEAASRDILPLAVILDVADA